MKPSVSIVIVNWNSGPMLMKCLRLCLEQTVPADRIFVVDNASQDDSLQGVDELPGVTLMRMPTNLGFAAGNNRAVACCETDFVVLLNPDAFPEPRWLEALLDAAQASPDVAAFGSRQMQEGVDGMLDGTGDQYFISGRIRRAGYRQRCMPSDLMAREIFSPCAAAAMYRLDVFRECEGFDEDFFCYAEDVDLGFRMRLLGHRAWYVPGAVVHHVGSGAVGGQHSNFATYHGHRNLVWVFVKNMPGSLFWLFLPIHVALNIASVIVLAARFQGRIAWRAKRDSILGIPKFWGKRLAIQSARKAHCFDLWRIFGRK
ncbi:glycosyltransferase family 2 protein [Variovorax sp. N23]|uniref:glycosyltransferase family 2 protein n=1 Tax=Variovorax sp. N23 TaxID=2980555 RepID=UPI0021C694FF|nr:glycosyltransferase family 2 protein [Variovorax sp. N23]MCU4121264.1 glycosyltransferase family 2 protein [Variovorax sp. N23]